MAEQKPGNVTQSEGFPEWILAKQKAEAERDAIKAALEAQKALATQELEIVKAQQGLLSQLLPKGQTTALEGTVTGSEKYDQLGQILAYQAVDRLTEAIAAQISGALKGGERVLVVDALDRVSGDAVLVEVESQIKGYATALTRQTSQNQAILAPQDEEVMGVVNLAVLTSLVPLALGAVSSLADIVGYFKTDYSVKGATFEIPHQVLASALAGRLHRETTHVYIDRFYLLGESQLMADLSAAMQQAVTLQASANRLAREVIDPSTVQGANKQEHPKLREAKAAVEASKTLLSAFEGFTKAITTSADDKTPSRLVQAALRQKAQAINPTHLLWLSAPFSASEAVTNKQRLGSSDSIRFIAGVTVSYLLATAEGSVVLSGNRSEVLKWDCPVGGDHFSEVAPVGKFTRD